VSYLMTDEVGAGRLCGSQIVSSAIIEEPCAENNQHFDSQIQPVAAVADTVDVHQFTLEWRSAA
jgi:hypothetical protein